MPKRTTVKAHLSLAAMEERYQKAGDPVARSQWHILWLLAQDKSVAEVTALTGTSPGWIRALARRYNIDGVESIGDRRHNSTGDPPMLNTDQQQELLAALQTATQDGDRWDGPKVAAWIAAKTGRDVRRQRGWEYLRKLGFDAPHPRPQQAKVQKAL